MRWAWNDVLSTYIQRRSASAQKAASLNYCKNAVWTPFWKTCLQRTLHQRDRKKKENSRKTAYSQYQTDLGDLPLSCACLKKKRRQSLWVITRWPSQNTWSRAIFCRMSSLFRLRHLIFPLSHVLPPCGRAEKRALEGPALERRDMVDMPLCNVEKRKRCCYFCVYNNEKSDRQCFMTHAGCLHEPWDCKGAGNAKKYGLVRATRSTIGDNVAATHGR